MPDTTTRDQIQEAIDHLPPDATYEDAIERLVFLAKIEAGLGELDAGKGPRTPDRLLSAKTSCDSSSATRSR